MLAQEDAVGGTTKQKWGHNQQGLTLTIVKLVLEQSR